MAGVRDSGRAPSEDAHTGDVARSEREHEEVEFLDAAEPEDGARPGGRPRRWLVAVLGLGVLAAVGVLTQAGRPSGRPRSTPTPIVRSESPTVSSLVPVADPVSAAMQATFGAHIPGSIVTEESSQLRTSDRTHTLVRRQLVAVSGNVVISVTIARDPVDVPATQTVRLHAAGYVVAFGFRGYYAPSLTQLRALAADPRLVSVAA